MRRLLHLLHLRGTRRLLLRPDDAPNGHERVAQAAAEPLDARALDPAVLEGSVCTPRSCRPACSMRATTAMVKKCPACRSSARRAGSSLRPTLSAPGASLRLMMYR